MKNYIEIPAGSANRLINHGPTVLVATKGTDGRYDIAPVAWNCPASKDPPRVLLVVGKSHITYDNIESAGEFIVCVPHIDQVDMVMQTGTISGREVDKFNEFSIKSVPGQKVDAMVPEGCVAYIECKTGDFLDLGGSKVIIGEILCAAVDDAAFDERLLTESPAGKTIHHNGGRTFSSPADSVVDAWPD